MCYNIINDFIFIGAIAMSTSLTSKRTLVEFQTIDPFFDFQLGKVSHLTARTPLEDHIHQDAIEITYFIKGEQVYTIGQTNYTIKSGEVFITLPNELHSSGSYPKDKSLFYYLIINIHMLRKLLFNEEESLILLDTLLTIKKRTFKVDPALTELFETLLACGMSPSPFYKTRIRSLLCDLLLKVIEAKPSSFDSSQNPMQKVLDYIDLHIYEDLTMSHLARIAHLSEGRFKANFRSYAGIPPREYILRQKIKHAKKLLKDETLSITHISYKLGFSSSQYFSTVFKRFTSISPIDYRNKQKQQKEGPI